jgi:hypothetical protein
VLFKRVKSSFPSVFELDKFIFGFCYHDNLISLTTRIWASVKHL